MTIEIAKLRPTDETASAISAALAQIAAARADAEAQLAQTVVERDRLMLEGSAKEIAAAEKKFADTQLDLERLSLLHAKIEPTLEFAREREAREARAAEIADLEADIEASDRRWNDELPELVAAIRVLVDERLALADRASALRLYDHAATLREGAGWTPPTTEAMRKQAAAEQAEQARRAFAVQLEIAAARQEQFDRRNREVAEASREREKQGRIQPAVIQTEDRLGPGLVSSTIR